MEVANLENTFSAQGNISSKIESLKINMMLSSANLVLFVSIALLPAALSTVTQFLPWSSSCSTYAHYRVKTSYFLTNAPTFSLPIKV